MVHLVSAVSCGGLVGETTYVDGSDYRGLVDGIVASPPETEGADSFALGRSIHKLGRAGLSKGAQHVDQHEWRWHLSRECRRRKRLLAAQKRADQTRIYKERETAKRDIFDYIEMFYNPFRRYGISGGLSAMDFFVQFSRV